MTEKQTFNDVFIKLLSERFRVFTDNDRTLDKSTCSEIYQVIFNCLVDVLKQSSVQLKNETVNWIAQSYYTSLKINGKHELNPNIFTQKAKLEEIESKELALIAMLLQGTDFSAEVVHFLKTKRG